MLLEFPEGKWLFGDAFQGTQILGGTGSGKTSGSGASIALAMLKAGFGGLVLTAKENECARWRRYAGYCGRADDVVELSVNSGCAFNILEYEFYQGGMLTHNIVTLLLEVMTSGGDGGGGQREPYWTDALQELVIHTVDLAVLGSVGTQVRSGVALEDAKPRLRLSEFVELIRSAPQSLAELASPTWKQGSFCWAQIEAAYTLIDAGLISESRKRDLEQTVTYWLGDFPNLASRTRSIIVSMATSKVAGLLRHPIREMFFEETDPRLGPSISMSGDPSQGGRPKILVINIPVKVFNNVGRFCQVLYKTIWQRAADRRSGVLSLSREEVEAKVRAGTLSREVASCTCPAFLWADESQYFVTGEDTLFQQTARDSRVATVYLTQNINNYKAALGSSGSDARVASLLGNLQTKIFHANGDPDTNKYAESLFGQQWLAVGSKSVTHSDSIQDNGQSTSSSRSANTNQQLAPVVEQREFTLLPSGGSRYDLSVHAWIFQAGRNWKGTGKEAGKTVNVVYHAFPQVL